MQRILVLGANGRTGHLLVTEALARGYKVTALLRDGKAIMPDHVHLKVVKGTPYNLEDVLNAAEQCTAIVSTLGHKRSSDMPWAKELGQKDILTRSVVNSLQAMKEKGVSQLVRLSALGVGDSFYKVPLIARIVMRHTSMKVVYRDHEQTERLLKESTVRWVSVRAAGLTNHNKHKGVSISYGKRPASLTISRSAVAMFMLDCLETSDFDGKTPVISGG